MRSVDSCLQSYRILAVINGGANGLVVKIIIYEEEDSCLAAAYTNLICGGYVPHNVRDLNTVGRCIGIDSIMVWNKCTVSFNTGISGIFCSGDIVTGTVVIEFSKNQTIEYLTFEIVGESEIQWTRPSPTSPYIRSYHLMKRVLEIKINLNGVAGDKVLKGIHQTNFLFTLPEDMPSTFEGSCGYTKYWAKVEGKSPHWFRKTEIVPMAVATKVDLNHIPGFLTPSYHQIEKEFLLSGKVTACVKGYTGFAPGQRVPFEVTIGNEKAVAISKLKLSLIQMVLYTTATGYANEVRKICSTEVEKLPTGKVEVFHMNLMIKPCAPSTFTLTAPMIAVTYALRVEFIFPYHFSAVEEIPVTVASLPVLHYEQN